MDLEKLNKSQVVLLTLLISFVTSLATGIVAVALMEQAPPAITQTVNRIVERTVERVASQAAAVASATTPAPTVVREGDLMAKAIEKVSPSVVRLFTPGKDESGKDIQLFIGLAIVSDASGILVADAGTPDGPLTALRSDNVEVPVTIIDRPKDANLIRLQAATTTGEKNDKVNWVPATFSSKDGSLGQSVVAIAGRTSPHVAKGIITAIPQADGKDSSAGFVETDIPADSFAAGSPLIDADGNVIAVATRDSRIAAPGGFLASSKIVLQNKAQEGGQKDSPAP
ncbi:hypothetical protein A2765_01710 [Candidatus Kaiserbacteria bacterium RIFCSPHIGHO2_01_FULL_56_24]|uniref:Serine protease n=1 Tax=Candidatus Kaiserbacteria bacterium RIFCSPHIGHO2_01_FULL_56_24 TaxID=1798487 RepID=A0A1F6DHC0_9BACT|nr:MAG: hypothetical protein A2765_01710 [Candidatus Kaiserbacteria bacterium RIFCSPHIGHO2_01_FULL_56_24]